MKYLIAFVLYVWQLPQNILGFVLSLFGKKHEISGIIFYSFNKFFDSGISLGQYIIIDSRYFYYSLGYLYNTLRHEYGHSLQSKKLGWLYLLIVGIPSVARNIFDRLFHKKWTYLQRYDWYYSGFPENWANQLGGIEYGHKM